MSTSQRQSYLSSLVVRPTESSGGGGCDYESGEVRQDLRSDRFPESGYGVLAGSGSPLHHRKYDHYNGFGFGRPSGSHQDHGFKGGRGYGSFQDYSPPYGRGRSHGRSYARGFDEPGFGPPPFRGEGMNRNNPNVSPREGDWICPDPSCGNLNFARRECCNNCNRPRFGPAGSPRRSYQASVPHAATLRFSGPSMNRSPARGMNDYRSPPRDWDRGRPRVFGADPPHLRSGGKFPDIQMQRGRLDYPEKEEDYRGRDKFDGPPPLDWGVPIDCGRENSFHERRGYGGRNDHHPLSPLPPSHHGWQDHDLRERSRSPVRVGPPPRDFRRDPYFDRGLEDTRDFRRSPYMDRGLEGRQDMIRGRMGEPY